MTFLRRSYGLCAISLVIGVLTLTIPPRNAQAKPGCDARNGGIQLPPGFCATVFADKLGPARHMAVRDNGDVYVALSRARDGGTIVALRDTDGDGHADKIERFGQEPGTGIGIHDGALYFASTMRIVRYPLQHGDLLPKGPPQVVVGGIPEQRQHSARSLAFDRSGWLYMNSGAPSNGCQRQDRTPGSRGMDPCPLLRLHGGIWRFQADRVGQTYGADQRFATGIRNAVAIAWNTADHHLYVVQHGRDELHGLWPKIYSVTQGVHLPAEQFFEVEQGDNFGWPYCYYDPEKNLKVLAPEYGGDGTRVGRCAEYKQPIVAFPAHWAPDGLLFYSGRQFPARYRGGAFIAFHGSWNRTPKPQQGYKVVFVPFRDGRPGKWQDFALGFAGAQIIHSPGEAEYRPTGLAQGPHGALYISDDHHGRIWRVTYVGKR